MVRDLPGADAWHSPSRSSAPCSPRSCHDSSCEASRSPRPRAAAQSPPAGRAGCATGDGRRSLDAQPRGTARRRAGPRPRRPRRRHTVSPQARAFMLPLSTWRCMWPASLASLFHAQPVSHGLPGITFRGLWSQSCAESLRRFDGCQLPSLYPLIAASTSTILHEYLPHLVALGVVAASRPP